jgi:reactive intermediate/imine deaminase
MTHQIIHTDSAPQAIGTYSQAVRVGKTVYVSGQTPIDPKSGELVKGDIEVEIRQCFDNLLAVVTAADGTFSQVAKVTIFLTDLVHFPKVNEIMATYFRKPYPARSTVGVAQLPKGSRVEIECILCLD